MTTRILIADDHGIVAEGLKLYLERAGFDVIGRAATGQQAIELTLDLKPDVLLLDIRMPGMDGLEALAAVKKARSSTRVIMMTSLKDSESLSRAISMGAAGYIPKDSDPERIPEMIKAVVAGEAIVDLEMLKTALINGGKPKTLNGRNGDSTLTKLTDQEVRVLALLGEGNDNSTIAGKLVISPSTVKSHVMSIFRKLDVSNRTQAAIWAINHGVTVSGMPN
jgi:DNA-binding NarL/FixJ family response regulator